MASRKAGYTEEELLSAGLASRSRDGSGLFDRFRERIMFPLADERGRVLGFGARAMREGQGAKYLNTSDGELFHKGRMVYGADLARAAAAKAGRVVLVEGYTDVIALRQAGVPEAVCSMGTALTAQQVDALARLAPKVLFCQDPDAAGQKAVGRGLEGLAEHNSDRRMGTKVDFRIVRLPAGGGAFEGSPPPGDDAPVVHEDPGPEAGSRGPNGALKVLDRREQTERAFLSYCLALPDEGEQRLAEADLDTLFSA